MADEALDTAGRGCGKDLGNERSCDGFRLCYSCFVATKPTIMPTYPKVRTPGQDAIAAALIEHAPRLRGLGHNYIELDANARLYIAKLAEAALQAQEGFVRYERTEKGWETTFVEPTKPARAGEAGSR